MTDAEEVRRLVQAIGLVEAGENVALDHILTPLNALAAKLENGFIAPNRLSRDQAEPLCELEGGCERTGECYGDCECNSKVIEAWDKLRAALKENSDET